MTASRFTVIDIMRAIAIVLVVLGHALIFAREATWLMQAIYSFHMPLLFSISGYVTALSLRKARVNASPLTFTFFRGKIARSARRLLVPYALGALVLIPIINAGIVNDIPRAFAEAWHKALFTNRSLWFLPCCFFLVAVYTASVALRSRFRRLGDDFGKTGRSGRGKMRRSRSDAPYPYSARRRSRSDAP